VLVAFRQSHHGRTIQIEELAHRPAYLATVIEDGGNRHYVLPEWEAEERACIEKLGASKRRFIGGDQEAHPTSDYPSQTGGPINRPYREVAGFMLLISTRIILVFGQRPKTFGGITRNTRTRYVQWNSTLDTVSGPR